MAHPNEDVMASDDHVVALIKASGERNGVSGTFDTAHVWHVAGGKATEFWAISVNPYEDDEFWS